MVQYKAPTNMVWILGRIYCTGTPEEVMAPVRQNFDQIRPFLSDKADLTQLEALQAWAESSFERLKPLLSQRKLEGYTRECHGDIHLGNATLKK